MRLLLLFYYKEREQKNWHDIPPAPDAAADLGIPEKSWSASSLYSRFMLTSFFLMEKKPTQQCIPMRFFFIFCPTWATLWIKSEFLWKGKTMRKSLSAQKSEKEIPISILDKIIDNMITYLTLIAEIILPLIWFIVKDSFLP